jgi:FkbM family methyltransferase
MADISASPQTPQPDKALKTKPVLGLASLAARLLPLRLKRLFYRSPRLARFIRQELNRAAPQGYSVVEIAGGELAGLYMSLDLHAEKDYWLGTYEPELLAALRDLVRPGWVAYDLGANIGYISLLLARLVGQDGGVASFEALPSNLDRLRLNLNLNALQERVTVVSGAVGNSTEPVQFLLGPSDDTGKAQGSAGRQEMAYSQAITVPGIILDEFVFAQGNPPPAVVKIDIEGGEVLALPGMRRILAEARPLVCLELHGPEAAHVAWDTLVAAGYRLCRMAPGYPPVPSLEALDWKAYAVAFPLASG